MGDLITLVILGIALYATVLVHELSHWAFGPSGDARLTLNPLKSFARTRKLPGGLNDIKWAAGSLSEAALMIFLPPYFNAVGIFGLLFTGMAFIAFYSLVWRLARWGVLLPPRHYSDVSVLFGKNFRIACIVALLAVLIVFPYYVVNTPKFLATFLP